MPHAFEFRIGRHHFQLLLYPSISQINPTHNCRDKRIILSQTQEPMCFSKTVTRLHKNGFGNTTLVQDGLKVCRQMVAIEHPKLRTHPGVLEAPNLPEVLMTVDDHEIQVSSSYSEFRY